MIDTKGFITVAEAAKRLNRSTEQVRRNLREGKLRGQRIGNQWFVEIELSTGSPTQPLIPPALLNRILERRRAISDLLGDFDIVEAIHEGRERD